MPFIMGIIHASQTYTAYDKTHTNSSMTFMPESARMMSISLISLNSRPAKSVSMCIDIKMIDNSRSLAHAVVATDDHG